MRKVCIIVAGGRGTRIGAAVPKQFLLVNGRPILMHTIEKINSFEETIDIIVVLPKDEFHAWNELCAKHSFTIKHQLVEGGSERFFSVKNALDVACDDSLIAVHDGVRPFVSKATWDRCVEKSVECGTAIPCVTVTSSLRMKNDNGTTKSVDRSLFMEVQTPQMFSSEIIKKAYKQDYSPLFTDDASLTESAGYDTNVVDGNVENIKITSVHDLKIAEQLSANNY